MPDTPHRIVSLVPSHTETLHDLGLAARVVGRTRFCILPKPWVDTLPIVGGTKDARLEKILDQRPDLVVADRDENPKALIDELQAKGIEVLWSDIGSIEDVLSFLGKLGQRCGVEAAAYEWSRRIEAAIPKDIEPMPVFCPIWYAPWMTFDGTAYPSAMLKAAGFANAFAAQSGPRYFEVGEGDVAHSGARYTLLPTEPFPFHKRKAETSALGPCGAPERVRIIDGEALTWFGTHTVRGLEELAKVRATLA